MLNVLNSSDIRDLVANNLPTFRMILDVMRQKYKPPTIEPGISHEDLMYRGGQYSVLTHFEQLIEEAEAANVLLTTTTPK